MYLRLHGIHMYICAYLNMYTCACTYTYVYVYMSILIYISMKNLNIYIFLDTYLFLYNKTYIYIYVYVYIKTSGGVDNSDIGSIDSSSIDYSNMDGAWGEHEIDYILFTRATVDLSPNPEEVFISIYLNEYIALRLYLVLNVLILIPLYKASSCNYKCYQKLKFVMNLTTSCICMRIYMYASIHLDFVCSIYL